MSFLYTEKKVIKIIGLELVSLSHFLPVFWRKIFRFLYSITWQNVIVWLPLRYKCSDCLSTRLWRRYFSNQGIFSTWPKSQDKNLNILRTKWAFKMKQKAFFIIFKELSLKQINNVFRRWEFDLKTILILQMAVYTSSASVTSKPINWFFVEITRPWLTYEKN